MAFQIGKEQEMIRKTAREFGRKELAPAAMERDHSASYPSDIMKKRRAWAFGNACA